MSKVITLVKRVEGWKQAKYPVERQQLNHLWDSRQLLKVFASPVKPHLKASAYFSTVVFKKILILEMFMTFALSKNKPENKILYPKEVQPF